MGMLRAGSFSKPHNDDKREREKKGGAQGKGKERKKELRPVWAFKGEEKKEQRQGLAFKGEGKRSVAGGRREEKKSCGRRQKRGDRRERKKGRR